MTAGAAILLAGALGVSYGVVNVAPIHRVTVYGDRAEVTRITTTQCAGGTAAVIFPKLPLALDVRALKPEVLSGGEAIGVSHRTVKPLQAVNEEAERLQKELEGVQANLKKAQGEVQTWAERLSRLEAFADLALVSMRERARGPNLELNLWDATLDAQQEERLKVLAGRAQAQIRVRELENEADRLRRTMGYLPKAESGDVVQAEVAAKCQGGGEVRIALTYVVGGAAWAPEYDFRWLPDEGGNGAAGRAEITVSAVIRQSTGEAWDNAEVVLSTARPRAGTAAPRLAPVYLDGSKRDDEKTLVQATERRDTGLATGEAPPDTGAAAQVEDKGPAFALSVPGRVTIKADGRPYWFPVVTVGAAATAHWVAVGKLRARAYRMVRLKNPAAFGLFAGPMNVFRGRSFIGKVHRDFTGAGEPMEVSAGPGDELAVRRDRLALPDERKSALGGRRILERGYRIEVANESQREEEVEVRETVPVSKTEEIVVTLDREKTSPGFEFDAEKGVVTWRVKVGAQRSQTRELRYRIEIPADWKL